MKSRHTILPMLPILVLLYALSLSSCIYDDGSQCVQYTLTLKLSDTSGRALPDSLSGTIKAYMFVDGLYDRTIEQESGGISYVSFDGRSSVTFVAISSPGGDSLTLHTPTEGTKISNLWAELPQTRSSLVSRQPSLYYGSLSYTPESMPSSTVSAVLPLYNKRSRVCVVVRHIVSQFGAGDYGIRLSGFRRGISYGGETTGDSVTYNPRSRITRSGDLVSDTLSTLPTATSDKITETLIKDGKNATSFTTDDSGKPITIGGGEDRCIVIDVSKVRASVTIVPWGESEGGTVFY